MDKIKINLYDLLLCISRATDLVVPELSNHHHQVAYLAFRLAEQMGMPQNKLREILIAGLLHDIGALSSKERLELIENDSDTVNNHSVRGFMLLREFEPLAVPAQIIRYHHFPWDYGGGKSCNGHAVPLESHLLHLADRTCVLIKPNQDILTQVPDIFATISQNSGRLFMPEIVDALSVLCSKEYIWLDLTYTFNWDRISNFAEFGIMELDLNDVICISQVFSRVIDFRSHFTATHSASVAEVATKLGEIAGFSENECKMLLVAGYLHDLGKLAIDDTLLEKPSGLSPKEYKIVQCHAFYTYQLLDTIRNFETINKWASFHHEKMNGNGYPFHIKGESIPLGSRIMAVADIFTAITEPRPYREGMDKNQIVDVLHSMVADGSLCPKVVTLLLDNFKLLTDVCKTARQRASKAYNKFFNEMPD